MFHPIICLYHNTPANTYHPALFVEDPLPGPPSDDKPVRHRSKMHHTVGFSNRDDAVEFARNDLATRIADYVIGEPQFFLEQDIEWDGAGVPAIKTFFGEPVR